MDGRVLSEALSADLRGQSTQVGAASTTTPAPVDFTPDEQAEVEERLRALGYLG